MPGPNASVLELSPDQIRELVDEATTRILDHLAGLPDLPTRKVDLAHSSVEVEQAPPEEGAQLPELLDHLFDDLVPNSFANPSGGFMAFIPLAFHPDNTELEHLPGPTGHDTLLTIAVSRLMLDNFDHIKAYWIMLTPRIAQTALNMGADCIDGTVVEEKIVHMAGASSPVGLTMDRLLELIREAGRVPVQRDSLYNELQRFDAPAVA